MDDSKKKLAKVSMNVEAEVILEKMMKNVNEEFKGGRVSKNDLLSWIVIWFEQYEFEKNKKSIQDDHFDQLVYLENVLREAKEARKNGLEVDEVLANLVNKKNGMKKTSKNL